MQRHAGFCGSPFGSFFFPSAMAQGHVHSAPPAADVDMADAWSDLPCLAGPGPQFYLPVEEGPVEMDLSACHLGLDAGPSWPAQQPAWREEEATHAGSFDMETAEVEPAADLQRVERAGSPPGAGPSPPWQQQPAMPATAPASWVPRAAFGWPPRTAPHSAWEADSPPAAWGCARAAHPLPTSPLPAAHHPAGATASLAPQPAPPTTSGWTPRAGAFSAWPPSAAARPHPSPSSQGMPAAAPLPSWPAAALPSCPAAPLPRCSSSTPGVPAWTSGTCSLDMPAAVPLPSTPGPGVPVAPPSCSRPEVLGSGAAAGISSLEVPAHAAAPELPSWLASIPPAAAQEEDEADGELVIDLKDNAPLGKRGKASTGEASNGVGGAAPAAPNPRRTLSRLPGRPLWASAQRAAAQKAEAYARAGVPLSEPKYQAAAGARWEASAAKRKGLGARAETAHKKCRRGEFAACHLSG